MRVKRDLTRGKRDLLIRDLIEELKRPKNTDKTEVCSGAVSRPTECVLYIECVLYVD